MSKIEVHTNIPNLIVEVFNGKDECITKHGYKSSLMPYYSGNRDSKLNEDEIIIVDNLPKGLYSVRLSLPYFSGFEKDKLGSYYPMPVVMDKVCIIDKEDIVKTFEFKASINEWK